MIRPLTSDDATAAALLHFEGMPQDFLASFGIEFLIELYNGIISSRKAISYGYYKKNELLGIIVGTENTKQFMSDVMSHTWLSLLPILIKHSISKPLSIINTFQAVLYGRSDGDYIPAELLALSIAKNMRGKGVGTQLLSQLKKTFKGKKIFKFKVGTLSTNYAANKFYSHTGGLLRGQERIYKRIWNIYEYQLTTVKPTLSIILPTYNERENIKKLLPQLISFARNHVNKLEIINIDDNSPDKTADEVRKVNTKKLVVKSIVRTKIRGLASAIEYGLKIAKGDLIIVMDTDFNHDPKEIPHFLKLANSYDLVIGSRYVHGGGMENRTRQYCSYIFNLYIRLMLVHNIHDYLSGYFIIKRSWVTELVKTPIFHGFGDYFIRLIYYVYKRNGSIGEIPVFYKNRTYGVSKSDFIQMFITYAKTALTLRLNDFTT